VGHEVQVEERVVQLPQLAEQGEHVGPFDVVVL